MLEIDQLRCGYGEVDEAIVAAGIAFVHVVAGIELFDFATEAGFEVAHVTQGDGPNSAFGSANPLPQAGHVKAEWTDRSHAGDNDAALVHECVLLT